nr:membrane glycoprotein E51 [Elephant endotheliotropic herpesvirus 1A]
MMGGGLKTVILIHAIFMDNFFPYLYCAQQDLCHSTKKLYKPPTISISNDQINITVQIENNDFYILEHNGSIICSTSPGCSNVKSNKTQFTLVADCASATGSYMLLTGAHQGSICQYFNVTNCPPYSTPTRLAQSSCSKCNYATFTTTAVVILMFYLIF